MDLPKKRKLSTMMVLNKGKRSMLSVPGERISTPAFNQHSSRICMSSSPATILPIRGLLKTYSKRGRRLSSRIQVHVYAEGNSGSVIALDVG